ncbi:hypothetical protein ACVRWQ_00630 [Streptococcus phocae subsp. salmonis]|uniref:hypothetical protein n=1 Tax=Streptococcus phocae TaxID=119224 RepID=UPI0005318781|nr:hypothetical protein [Streptococcus phocae]KGR73229.1 hypothetical protein NX86_01515 [Streptococcus phocae subsp. salmonis]
MKKLLAIGAAALILSTTAVGTVGASSVRELRADGERDMYILRSSYSNGVEDIDTFNGYLRLIGRSYSMETIKQYVDSYEEFLKIKNGIL